MKPNEDILHYLDAVITMAKRSNPRPNRYTCVEHLVRELGRPMEVLPRARWPRWVPRGVKQECFRNASLLALSENGLTYCEGYACDLFIPVLHAWVIDAEGRVIDNTWKQTGQQGYWGVAVKTGFLRDQLLRQEKYGLLYRPGSWSLFVNDPSVWQHQIKREVAA